MMNRFCRYIDKCFDFHDLLFRPVAINVKPM